MKHVEREENKGEEGINKGKTIQSRHWLLWPTA